VNGQSPRDFNNLIVFINIQRQEFLDYVSPTVQPEETRLLLSNVPASLLLVFGVLEDTGALKSSILEIDLSRIEYFVHLEPRTNS